VLTLRDIEDARRRIGDRVVSTPCQRSEVFSALTGNTIFFKFENLQLTGSFKERGALNKLLQLTPEERARGVIAASAGNHAQGVAYHAGRLSIRATIVMPETTPLIKVSSTRSFGARVVLHGQGYDDAYAEARRIAAEEGSVFVHAFDDEAVLAGQGTIGLELLEQNPYLEAVVVPVGGGGLISGIATAVKEVNPSIQVIGVEAAACPKMRASIDAGAPVAVTPQRTIAEGIATKRPGELTFPIVKKLVDELVAVSEEEIANAILLLLEREKTMVEGAGAAALAAMVNRRTRLAGRKVAVVLSGGNIDVNLLARIIERGLAKDGRLVRLAVTIQDRPGQLASLTALIGKAGANILEIHHNRALSRAALGDTEVEVTLETRGPEHVDELMRMLAAGYAVRREA
jgi:threonine dehydratase